MATGKRRRDAGARVRTALSYLGFAAFGVLLGILIYWLVGPKVEKPATQHFRFLLQR